MYRNVTTLMGASVAVITACLVAGPASAAQPAQPAADEATLGEVVVTARRQTENLQDVPVSIQVVTGDALLKSAITQGQEISKFTPGLRISVPDANDPEIVMRGVRWTTQTGTPAIPLYLNEISFEPTTVLQTMYDIGQIEVLRGPQGTSRGAPSIPGAVTLTTHEVSLSEYGGYVSALVGSHGHGDVQGAVNVPLIQDKLAVRLAGNFEDSEGNEVHSLNNGLDPSLKVRSGRITVKYEPTSDVMFVAMYQRLNQDYRYFSQVAGPGSAGLPALGLPANFNGPAIAPNQYLAVQDGVSSQTTRNDLVSLNATWDVMGQRLSYNFGWAHAVTNTVLAQDLGNLLPGSEVYASTNTPRNQEMWNELRLSSLRGQRFFDYDIGFYEQNGVGHFDYTAPAVFLPGAFGNPADLPSPFQAPLERYTLGATTGINFKTQNYSFYGNLTFHLPFQTELSGGLRWIHDRRPAILTTVTAPAFAGFSNPLAGLLTCEALSQLSPAVAGAVTSPVYPATCDLPIASQSTPAQVFGKTFTPVIYNVSLSHKFTDDFLAYGTIGTSWRQGLPSINNPGLPEDLAFPKPEKATSYELGVKTNWGRRLRVNADIFQINYKGQLNQFQGVPYFNAVSDAISQTSIAFVRNEDARVRGIETEISAEPIRNLTLNLNLTYAQIQSVGGEAPCTDPSRPLTAANPINFCPVASGTTINSSAPFQGSFNGDYTVPIGPIDGYLRFNVNYQGHNPNFGASQVQAEAYALVDLFAGLTGQEGGWDVGVYAKNVFDKKVLLASTPYLTGIGLDTTFGATGYSTIATTIPREVGVAARYSWGSR